MKANGLKRKSYQYQLLNTLLVETYGKELKVIDVAGGNGDLTREIMKNETGCAQSSMVIDPRRDTDKCGKDVE